MGQVFLKREDAPKHTVTAGDTLAGIAKAKCEAGIDWPELALYNWATQEPAEVNRALIEIVGASEIDDANPGLTKLDPALGTKKEILIPKVWKKSGLAQQQTHTIKVRQRLPAPAVSITKLDKWFLPEIQTCDVDYQLEGVKERADKVDFEVYGSHYAKAAATAEGEFFKYTYTEVDVPIWHKHLPGPKAEQRKAHEIRDWHGESEATDGILKPAAKKNRYVNAAFSPYTVLVRYYKDAGDNKARIKLNAFWPQFASAAPFDVDENSLKIEWTVENCTKLKNGQLLITNDLSEFAGPVFRRALGAGDLSNGNHSFDWKAEGKKIVFQDFMPYRVQIQAHSDMDEDNGIALAVMHTDVRLWANAFVGADPANELKDPQCLGIALAPYLPPPRPGKKTDRWFKLQLAKGGFQPGPVHAPFTTADSALALKNFQRSFTKSKLIAIAPFGRLAISGTLNQDTKAVIKSLKAETWPQFADPGTRDNYKLEDVSEILADNTGDLIVWADDRNCTTEDWDGTFDASLGIDNYRGNYAIGDARVTRDAQSIPRPWIPVEVTIPVLSKGDLLYPTDDMPEVTEAMRRAVGPLRVDWTFTELDQDYSVIPIGANAAEKNSVRSHKWVEEQIKNNCPETFNAKPCGGIRPDPLDTYYRKPFGFTKDESLLPWLAMDDNGTKTVCSLVHDDLGQDPKKVYKDYIGKAGVYLRPSRIAGDGYRFRAQVSFKPLPGGGDLPNRAVLEQRYAKRPQSHTAGLRVWRKTSYRGYVPWLPAVQAGWDTNMDDAAALYLPAFVHFVHEGADPAKHQDYTVTSLVPAAGYVRLVRSKLDVVGGYFRGIAPKYTAGYTYPYLHRPHYGIEARPGDLATFINWFWANIEGFSWDRYFEALIHALVGGVERKHRKLRGHLLVEFESTPRTLICEYTCQNACVGQQFSEIVNDASGAADPATGIRMTTRYGGRNCPAGCGGQFQETNRMTIDRFPFSSLGDSMSGVWVFLPRAADLWAHEMGHNRNLQHAQSNLAAVAANPGTFDNKQHDSVANAHQTVALAPQPHERFWDRYCTMGYDTSAARKFCGKCIMKNRGWAVEDLPNPAGNVQDA